METYKLRIIYKHDNMELDSTIITATNRKDAIKHSEFLVYCSLGLKRKNVKYSLVKS